MNKSFQEFLDLTGLTTEEGQLERAVAPIHLLAPSQVEKRGDRLVWSPGFMNTPAEEGPRPRRSMLKDYARFSEWMALKVASEEKQRPQNTRKVPGPGLLTEFVALEGGTDDDIVAYVRRWGPLCICTHGLPCSHHEDCLPMRVKGGARDVCWEPLASWRHFAGQAAAILVLAGMCHKKQLDTKGFYRILSERPPSPEPPRRLSPDQEARRADRDRKSTEDFTKWALLMTRWVKEHEAEVLRPKSLHERLRDQRLHVAGALNKWIQRAFIRPLVVWEASEPSFDMTSGSFGQNKMFNDNLFGALAMELTYAVLRQLRLRKCDGCGRQHSPRRWPAPGTHSFCPQCGKRAAWRLSKRRLRSGGRPRSSRIKAKS